MSDKHTVNVGSIKKNAVLNNVESGWLHKI